MVRCQRCCLAPGAAQAVISRRKTIRAVIIRTIIDGTTDMRESPDWIVLSMMAGDGFRPGPLLPGFFGEPVAAWVLHLQCGNKADLVAPEIIISAVRQNFVKVSPDALMNRECGISATCCWGAEGGARSDYPGGRGTQIGKCAHVGSLSLASPVAISTILRIEADPLSEGPVPLEGLRGLSDSYSISAFLRDATRAQTRCNMAPQQMTRPPKRPRDLSQWRTILTTIAKASTMRGAN